MYTEAAGVCAAAAKNMPTTGSHPAPANPHHAASSTDAAARWTPTAAVTSDQPPSWPMPVTPTQPRPASTTVQWIRLVTAVPHSPPSETYVEKTTAAAITPPNIDRGVSVLRMTPMT